MRPKRLITTLLIPAAFLVDCFLWLFVRWALRDEFSLRRHRVCRFYGDEDFHKAIDAAMSKIQELDPEAYDKVAETPIMIASQWKPKNKDWNYISFRNGLRNHYSVSKWMVEDGVDSLAFWIVFTYYKFVHKNEQSAYEKLLQDPDILYLKCVESAMDWLRAHEYTEESIDYFGRLWYERKFRSHAKGAYQDSSDNADKPRV